MWINQNNLVYNNRLTESKENKFYRETKKSTEIGKNLLILSKNYPCSYSFYRNKVNDKPTRKLFKFIYLN